MGIGHQIPAQCTSLLGESGENSNVWFTEAINLLEDNDIGWAWWPWKRIETIVCPYSIKSNANYEAIIKYWKGEGSKPSVDVAVQGLTQLTSDLLVDNNVYYKDVIDAMLRQPQDETHIPYANHSIPGVVYLSDYDLGTNGIAYNDIDYANYTLSSGEDYQPWNSGWAYRNDGVDIQTNSDAVNSNGYHIAYTKDNEWLKYTLNVTETGFYSLKFRYASPESAAKVEFFINEADIAGNVTLGSTGGWNNFVNHTINNSYLEEGSHVLKVQIDGNKAVNMSSLEFIKTSAVPEFKELSSSTINDEKSIQIVLNHPIINETLTNDLFEVKVNNEAVPIESVAIDTANNRRITIKLVDYLFYQDKIKVSYIGSTINSTYNELLNTFNELVVDNNLITRLKIPGKIQVEDFTSQVGLEIENTSDTGGGQNIGYTDTGDYAEYLVFIAADGNYNLHVRTAAQWNTGKIEFELLNKSTTQSLSIIDLPVTGGWQSWQTTTKQMTLPAGVYILRMKILSGYFNMNWFEFEFVSSLSIDNHKKNTVAIYPNPISEEFEINLDNQQKVRSLKILDVGGRVVKNLQPNLSDRVYHLSNLKPGIYFLLLETDKERFQKKIIKK